MGVVTTDLLFPVKGLDRAVQIQTEPPYSSVDLRNVRPWSSLERRIGSGGSRPGMMNAFYETLGSGYPVNMMGVVDVMRTDNAIHFAETFDNLSIGRSVGAQIAGGTEAALRPVPTIDTLRKVYYDPMAASGMSCFSLAEMSPAMDTTADHSIAMLIVPRANTVANCIYELYLRMSNSLQPATVGGVGGDGIQVSISTTASASVAKVYRAGLAVTTYSMTDPTITGPTWFRATYVAASNTLKVYVGGTQILSQVVTLGGGAAYRMGFGLHSNTSPAVYAQAAQIVVDYTSTASARRPRRLFLAAANGTLYRETARRGETEAAQNATTLTLAADRRLMGTQSGQKYFIADRSDALIATDGATDGAGTGLTSASLGDFAAKGVTANSFVVTVTSIGTGATLGQYTISSVVTTTITLSSSAGANKTGIGIKIERCPKYYSETAAGVGSLTLWRATTAGTIPLGFKNLSTYRNRAVCSNTKDAPNAVYFSAVGDFFDFNYSPSNPLLETRAFQTTASTAGEPGSPVVFQAAFRDDHMVFGCVDSLWILRGDPASGGRIDKVPTNLGVLDSWCGCFDQFGGLYFLSRSGMAYMQPDGSAAVPLSKVKIPKELLNVDTEKYQVTMAFDVIRRGIHIFISEWPSSSGSISYQNVLNWWYDLDTNGFFPDTYWKDVISAMWFSSDWADQSCVMLGCADGVIRRFSDRAESDCGSSAIYSYVEIGPVRLGGSTYTEGMVQDIVGVLPTWSNPCGWAVRVGDDAQTAFLASVFANDGGWSAGMNYRDHIAARAGAMFLRVHWQHPDVTPSNEGMLAWAFDVASVRIEQYSEVRKI